MLKKSLRLSPSKGASKYEEKNKEERKSKNGNFQAMMPRTTLEEINEFLKINNITKVQLVIEGYNALKKQTKK